jgi:YggT family protein
VDLRSAIGTAILAACFLAAVKIVKMSVYILMVAVIVQAVLSFVHPHSPVMPLFSSLTAPFLRPLQKRIPPVANFDLTPLVLVIILQLLLMVPVAWLEINVTRLL